jgi:hypothetical protein
MSYSLREGVSFCIVDGRSIFLDLGRDRYLGIGPTAEHAFQRLISNESLTAPDRSELDKLCAQGLVDHAADGATRPRASSAPRLAASMWEGARARITWHGVPHLCLSLAHSALLLRARSLKRAVGEVARLKRSAAANADSRATDRLPEYVGAFASTGLVFTTHNQCLWHSLALASFLARMGLTSDLVFGVRLRPFAAHCWVQRDDQLLNDSLDRVANFTPILVI